MVKMRLHNGWQLCSFIVVMCVHHSQDIYLAGTVKILTEKTPSKLKYVL